MRKGEYEVTKIREKMVYNEERRLGFIKQRDALKDLRMKNQVYSEMQREGIRNTTYYMSVWNMWNMNVVRSIIGNPGAVKNKSIEALIINQAAITAKNKRTKQANSGNIYIYIYKRARVQVNQLQLVREQEEDINRVLN